jgi:predicted nucleic acid-binding protein
MASGKPVFLDTSGWIAVLSADDELHGVASALLPRFSSERRILFTTDWVLAEAANGLARTAARNRFPQAVTVFRQSSNGRLVRVDGQLFDQALELYQQARDKTWGLTDCASFLVMRAQGIHDALTADRHFEQAGFECLLPRT